VLLVHKAPLEPQVLKVQQALLVLKGLQELQGHKAQQALLVLKVQQALLVLRVLQVQ
jgi:hypothetical protein